MAQTQENKKTFYIVLILLLIVLNAFFAYQHWTTKKELVKTTEEKNTLDSLLTIAKDSLAANDVRITSLQGRNAELDSLMASRQKELEEAIGQLEKLKKEGNYTRKQLDEARNNVKKLQEENKRFLGRIDSLSTQVQFLTKLSDSLNTGLQVQKNQNQQLLTEKDFLARKVEIGSLLKPENVVGTGVFMKSNDREVPTSKAKKSTKLKICFDVPENVVAEPGTKTMLIRLLNPQGATIWVTSSGSGSFTTDTGEEKQYTLAKDFEYNNQKQNVCAYWEQTQGFGSGDYTAIFYQDGHELGQHKFELK